MLREIVRDKTLTKNTGEWGKILWQMNVGKKSNFKLAREGGSVLMFVTHMKGDRYPCVLALPSQEGEAAARAQVTTFLDKCPDPGTYGWK